MKENRRKVVFCGLQAEGRRFESVNAHKKAISWKDNKSQRKIRSLLVSRLTDFFVFHGSQKKTKKDTKRQGVRVQIVCENEW